MDFSFKKSWKRSEAIDAIMVLTKLLEVPGITQDTKDQAEKKIREIIEKKLNS